MTESETTKTFPIADVLSTITDKLLGEIDGMYRVHHFMAGERVLAHQLPRVGSEIRSVVLRQHPQLAPIIDEAKAVTCDNWQQMLTGWTDRFGDTVALSPMTENDHQSIDPESELAEKLHPDRIITVKR